MSTQTQKDQTNCVECFKRFSYPEAFELQGINGRGSPIIDSMFGKGREFATFAVVEEGGEYFLTRAVSHFSENWRGKVHEDSKKIAKFGKLVNKRIFEESQYRFLEDSVFGKSSFEVIEVSPGTHLMECTLTFRMPTPKGLSFWAQVGFHRFLLEIVKP